MVVRDAEKLLLAQIESYASIDELETEIKAGSAPTELVAKFKLRRVLVLHDGTQPGFQDVAVARITSVTPEKQARERWYRRLREGSHNSALLIGSESRHGTFGHEAYVDATSVAWIPKQSVLKRLGHLDEGEMREVSRRLVKVLEIDPDALVPLEDA